MGFKGESDPPVRLFSPAQTPPPPLLCRLTSGASAENQPPKKRNPDTDHTSIFPIRATTSSIWQPQHAKSIDLTVKSGSRECQLYFDALMIVASRCAGLLFRTRLP